MKEFTYSGNQNDIQAILDIIQTYGLVKIPGFVSEEELASLRKEFDKILSTPDDKSKMETPYSQGQCVRITRKDFDASQYPSTSSFFGSSFMEDLKKCLPHS